MEYKKIVDRANQMTYNFLFYSPDYERFFFENLNKNIVIENKNTIYFYDKEENVLFWAGNTMEDVIKDLKYLSNYISKGKTILIKSGEDKNTIGKLKKIKPHFIKENIKVRNHNIGYKTNNLNYRIDSPLVISSKINENEEAFELICKVFGKEDFGMEIDEFIEYFNDDEKCLFIIKDDKKIVGVILGSIYNNGKTVFIRGLAVDKIYRGKGYSAQLLSRLFNWALENGVENSMLWVKEDNQAAINLYRKFGYFPYGDQEVTFLYTVH